MIGKSVSHYRITRQLGAGGMGAVYEAVDTRLDRLVALKFLPPNLTRDHNAKSRFIHEAKAASALDHTNVCNIHEVDTTSDGQMFIVMACYQGETLNDRIARGSLPFSEVVDITRQIISGLAKAHEHEIVHRDIKPANIFITEGGTVKILDFGLAKLHFPAGIEFTPQSATVTQMTEEGRILGTVAYMSPEQAEGRKVDQRSDIFSLGTVIYEMICGERPFAGETSMSTIGAILKDEPVSVTTLRAGVPPDLVRCLERCLEKDRELRPRDVRVLLADLDAAVGERAVRIPLRDSSRRWRAPRRGLALVVLSVVLSFVLAVVVGHSIRGDRPQQSTWLIVPEMEDFTAEGNLAAALQVALVVDLQQSHHVNIFTGRRLTEALRRMGKSKRDTMTIELACELAVREGVPVVLATSVDEAGTGYRLVAKLIIPNTHEAMHTHHAQAADRQGLLPGLDELSRVIREHLGERPDAIKSSDEPLAQVTTPSLAALQLYTKSMQAHSDQALALLRQAVAADKAFAMAHARLARLLFYRANTQAALAHSQVAFDLRHRLTDRERLYIEGEYYRYRWQYDKAIASMVTLLELYPDAADTRFNLIHTYLWVMQNRKALAEFEKLDDSFRSGFSYRHLYGNILARTGDFAGAIAQFEKVLAAVDSPAISTRMCLAACLISNRQYGQARSQMDTMLVLGSDGSIGADYMVGKALPALGQFSESLEHLQIARGNAWGVSDSNRVAWTNLYTGLCLTVKNEHADAVRAFAEAAKLWPTCDPLLGGELAAMGNMAGAREFEREFQALVAADPSVRNTRNLTKLRGTIAFYEGDYVTAVELLAACPLLIDARLTLGKAHAALGNAMSARTQFEYVIANQYAAFADGFSALWPLAYYYLGIVEQEAGNVPAAARHLRRFVELWSQADADVVEVTDARWRLRRLDGPVGDR